MRPQDLAEFARLVLAHDAAVAASHVEAMHARGIAMETLYLDLLIPAAQHLRHLWTEDLCDIAGVTIGLCRLQVLVRRFSPAFHNEGGSRPRDRSVLLVAAPGGWPAPELAITEEFFRRAGWDVSSGPSSERGTPADMACSEGRDAVCFCTQALDRIEPLASSIRAVRRASRDRVAGVLVGGPAFVERPDLVRRVGADAIAVDGRQVVLRAERLLSVLGRA